MTGSERDSGAPPCTAELGSLGIRHLKRFWARTLASKSGQPAGGHRPEDWVADNILLAGLRVGFRETCNFILQRTPGLEELEAWVIGKNGGAIDSRLITFLNAALAGETRADDAPPRFVGAAPAAAPFTARDLSFWEENGYVVLHDAVPPENCVAAARAIYEFIGADPHRPETWYPQRASIWVPLIHHPSLWANRDSPRIYQAFAQLWRRRDLWLPVDQSGFNPPEKPGWRCPDSRLHFDCSCPSPSACKAFFTSPAPPQIRAPLRACPLFTGASSPG